jgi:hypothetical protein
MNNEEAADILETVALRGFMSEPVEVSYKPSTKCQIVEFTDEEKKLLRRYLGENAHLNRVGRHLIPDLFGGGHTRTESLMGRMCYAMDSSDISPQYVSDLSCELREYPRTESEIYEQAKLKKIML